MGKNSYKPDKRRRELDRKAKQEAKRQKRQNKGDDEKPAEDNLYLEYLNPAGMVDDAEEESGEEDEHPDEANDK